LIFKIGNNLEGWKYGRLATALSNLPTPLPNLVVKNHKVFNSKLYQRTGVTLSFVLESRLTSCPMQWVIF
jgi:hypothetical protein